MRLLLALIAISLFGCAAKVVETEDSTPTPTYKEVISWQKSQHWEQVSKGQWVSVINGKPKQTLINGTEVDPKEYPAIVWFGFCTGSVIGPRTVLTAAHCVEKNKNLKFKVGNQEYNAIATIAPLYATKDLDIALAYTDREIEGVRYRTVQKQRDARQHERLMLTGFGCIRPGGGGGNDGTLRIGHAVLSSPFIRNYDLILKPLGDDKAALCFGDSGGPVFRENGLQIAVNSKGNIVDTSYVTRLDHPDSQAFMESWAERNKTLICGVNLDCRKNPNPGPPPRECEQRQFHFKDEHVQIQGVIFP